MKPPSFNMNDTKRKINIKVCYDPQPIRASSMQCPSCQNWFHPNDLTDRGTIFGYIGDFYGTSYKCPICGEEFDLTNANDVMHIIECNEVSEVVKDRKTKKVTWE